MAAGDAVGAGDTGVAGPTVGGFVGMGEGEGGAGVGEVRCDCGDGIAGNVVTETTGDGCAAATGVMNADLGASSAAIAPAVTTNATIPNATFFRMQFSFAALVRAGIANDPSRMTIYKSLKRSHLPMANRARSAQSVWVASTNSNVFGSPAAS